MANEYREAVEYLAERESSQHIRSAITQREALPLVDSAVALDWFGQELRNASARSILTDYIDSKFSDDQVLSLMTALCEGPNVAGMLLHRRFREYIASQLAADAQIAADREAA